MPVISTDPIADMFARLKNAVLVNQAETTIPYSRLKKAILKLLQKNNFIVKVVADKEKTELIVTLSDKQGQLFINGTARLSKPGRRVYVDKNNIPLVLGGRGMVIISTSSGILSGQEAKKRGLGGELIGKVW